MATPRVLILRAPGTNCDQETAFAFERAGGRAETIHVNRLLDHPALPEPYQIFCLPGGFSYGDDVAAGRILANQIRHHLYQSLLDFQAAGKLILGICNGFQVLIKAGLLFPQDLGADQNAAEATLTWNDSGRFEDRWVDLVVDPGPSVFLRGIERLYLPIAHAEGKFVAREPGQLARWTEQRQLALRYCRADGELCNQPLPFPVNPNGSMANVAGICDPTGRVLGLMPHPERHIDRTQHPRWTRGEGQDPGDGLALFVNAVRYFTD
jgi:phosphoribosylformylglycinamidine synthase subunit PurQ / glutaminase